MRASRLLSILILLQLRPQITAPALAREFEVSVRTILRDIDELSAAGVPVYAERGRGGGFRLREGFATRLNGLLGDEAQALPLLGLPGAASELGLGSASQRLKLKLQSALPGDSAALAGRLQARLHVDPLDWYQGGEPAPQLPALAQAVLECRRVRLDYLSWKGERRWQAEPLGLVLKGGSWYAVVRAGARTMMLKVANIQALQVADETFERPGDFELAAWWQASLQRFERELRPGRAVLRLTAEGRRRLAEKGRYAAEAVAAAVAEKPAGPRAWARVELPIEGVDQAARLAMSLAPEVEVLEPAEVRERVAQWARELTRRHRGGGA
ncbi:transcriptional regulator [Pelomonas sp. P7]|uniref:Transcriptional regulator n=1 Tax=Pelomonas caseinilytica TaxID=2906763 RepID=A0ABS8X8M6_9BURK|nr:transcriptional regulator [Pelomonas sp. P7]MCE4537079.1 transcriptional regulator [Pelomonas sp. P7]